uniref:Rz-like protein n=2 Tax=unclassified Uliginvirus TaxID=2744417 RepID=A0AAU6W0W2_9CAUD
MTSWKNILLVLALCGLAFWQYERASDWRDVAQKNEHDLLAERAKSQKTKTNVQVVVTKANKADKAVKEVLDDTPEFRDTVTPVPVVDRLCETIRCK